MQIELTQKNKDLAVAQEDAADLLKEISASTAIAEKEKASVAVIVEGVSAKADEIAIVKEDAERDLAAAKPALDAAVEALELNHGQGHRRAQGAEEPARRRQAHLRRGARSCDSSRCRRR